MTLLEELKLSVDRIAQIEVEHFPAGPWSDQAAGTSAVGLSALGAEDGGQGWNRQALVEPRRCR